MTIARKHDLKFSGESFFYAYDIKEGTSGRLCEGGRKQGGDWITEDNYMLS